MKLVIQIPCRDEVENLAPVVEDLPAEIPGVDEIETLVIDDGSTDGTAEKAIDLGVDHVLRFEVNRGLARTFSTGLRFSQVIGGDVIINTDGDHQYQGSYVTDFVKHLQSSTAAMVVGARDIKKIPHFSRTKKILQHLGSKVVGFLAGYPIPDAPCGFRAFTKSAASNTISTSRFGIAAPSTSSPNFVSMRPRNFSSRRRAATLSTSTTSHTSILPSLFRSSAPVDVPTCPTKFATAVAIHSSPVALDAPIS